MVRSVLLPIASWVNNQWHINSGCLDIFVQEGKIITAKYKNFLLPNKH